MRGLLICLGLLFALGGGAAAQQSKSEVLAEVDGKPITDAEVEQALGRQLQSLQEQIYSMKRDKVRAMIAERLLAEEAAKRAISVPDLLNTEVTSKLPETTEQDVDKFYQQNRNRLQGKDEAAARPQARAMLRAEQAAKAREAYVETLRGRAKVVVYLKEPAAVRAQVPLSGGIARGPENALVTIVEFTDFHCPFCRRVRPTIAELFAKFGDKLRYVHYDFPIAQLHPQAPRAHVAARCANDQGKFWSYHDELFAGPARSDNEQLETYAEEAKLDVAAFDQCLDSKKHEADVQKNIEAGKALGVNATPTFFINGRMVVGAKPLSAFVGIVEEELARK